jgi:hypothetical protein
MINMNLQKKKKKIIFTINKEYMNKLIKYFLNKLKLIRLKKNESSLNGQPNRVISSILARI